MTGVVCSQAVWLQSVSLITGYHYCKWPKPICWNYCLRFSFSGLKIEEQCGLVGSKVLFFVGNFCISVTTIADKVKAYFGMVSQTLLCPMVSMARKQNLLNIVVGETVIHMAVYKEAARLYMSWHPGHTVAALCKLESVGIPSPITCKFTKHVPLGASDFLSSHARMPKCQHPEAHFQLVLHLPSSMHSLLRTSPQWLSQDSILCDLIDFLLQS